MTTCCRLCQGQSEWIPSWTRSKISSSKRLEAALRMAQTSPEEAACGGRCRMASDSGGEGKRLVQWPVFTVLAWPAVRPGFVATGVPFDDAKKGSSPQPTLWVCRMLRGCPVLPDQQAFTIAAAFSPEAKSWRFWVCAGVVAVWSCVSGLVFQNRLPALLVATARGILALACRAIL